MPRKEWTIQQRRKEMKTSDCRFDVFPLSIAIHGRQLHMKLLYKLEYVLWDVESDTMARKLLTARWSAASCSAAGIQRTRNVGSLLIINLKIISSCLLCSTGGRHARLGKNSTWFTMIDFHHFLLCRPARGRGCYYRAPTGADLGDISKQPKTITRRSQDLRMQLSLIRPMLSQYDCCSPVCEYFLPPGVTAADRGLLASR